MKVANKISFAFLITAVLLTAVCAPLFYVIARKSLEERIYAHLETTAQSRAHHIETYLEEHKIITRILSSDILLRNTLMNIVGAGKDSNSNIENYDIANLEATIAELNEMVKVDPHLCEICIIGLNGKVLISTDVSNIGLDKSDCECFLNGREKLHIEDAHLCDNGKKGVISVSTPVLCDKNKTALGVIIVKVDLKSMYEITTDITGLGQTGEIFIVNREGYMITPSRFKKDTFLKQKVDTLNVEHCRIHKDRNHISRNQALNLFRSYRGTMVLGTHAYIPEMQWLLCSEMSEREAFAPLFRVKILFVIVMIFAPMGAWLIGIIFSGIISKPIRKLQAGAEIIGRGNLDYKVGVNTKDEIGQLSQAFDQMSEDLKESHLKLRESHKELEKKVQDRTLELSSTNKKLQDEIHEHSLAREILTERIKELRCLYGLSKLMEKQKVSLEQIFQETVDLVRSAYRYPDLTCVRITFEGIQYKTDNFKKSESSQYAGIYVRGEKAGEIAVYYLGQKSEGDQSPFIEEEHALLHAVAGRLGRTAERKKAAETLHLFQNLLNRSSDSIFVIEPKWGRFLDVNNRASESLGYTREELLNMTVKDVDEIILDDSSWKDHVKRVREAGSVVLEGRHRHKDGSSFPVELSIKFIDEDKKSYMVAIARDITERKHAEEKISRQSEFLRRTIESLGHPFYVINASDYTVAMANSAGQKEKMPKNATCYLISHGLDKPCGDCEHPCPLEQVKRTGEPLTVEHVHSDKDGNFRNVEVHAYPIFDNEGKVFQIIEYTIDITERKRAEEEVRESEQRLKTILESILTGVLIIDAHTHRIIDVNPIAEAMIGLPREDIVGSICHKFICPAEEGRCPITDLDQTVDKSERVLRKPDGSEIPILKTGTTMVVHGHEYLVESFVDITDRKLAEERQAQLLDEVKIANRELKDFAYIVSHDLKAPLRGIKTLSSWISTDYKDRLDDEGKEQMDLLSQRVERMHNLIDGVLQYSRVGRIKQDKIKIDLNELVPQVIDMVAPPENIEIKIEDELPLIEFEETRIIQVFQNLLSNAVKYMDKPRGLIKIGCVEEDGFWKFSVTDNGPGIEEKHFERIFRIFQTLTSRDEYESTGVGLTVVKKIVELYGGSIFIQSEVGKGSTFFFTLPKLGVRDTYAELETNTVS